MKKFIFYLLSALILTSCFNSNGEQTITTKDLYTVTIPKDLVKGKKLNDDASFQYANPFQELYIIVIDETQESFKKALAENELTEDYSSEFDGYKEMAIESLEEGLQHSKKLEDNETTINGLPAKTITLRGTMDGIDAYYQIAIMKGKKNYYQILTWTLGEKQNKHKETMIKMIQSFKEI